MAGFLAGVALVLAMAVLEIKPIDTRYVDLVRESKFIQFVQSTFGSPKDESGIQDAVSLSTRAPDIESISRTLVVDSALVPAASSEPDTGANEPELSVPTIVDGDAGETEAVDISGTNEVVAVQGAEDDLAIDDSSPESPEEAIVSAVTTGIPGFQLGSTAYYIEENGQALAVEIYRQGNLSIPASVELTTYAGSAESAVDFADFDRHEIRFEVGEASKTVFIPIVADALPESSEAFRIALSNSLGEIMVTERAIATVIIIDDDA
jgi:hypothetical protein